MQKQKGFTLIELLVVVAIIGMLSTIIIANLSTVRAKSRDSRRISDIKTIQAALSMYYTDNGNYPANIYTTLAPNYLAAVPIDPNGAVACTNGSQASCYKYSAFSLGSDNLCSGNPALHPPPTKYHIGSVLEETSNNALIQDADPVLATYFSGYVLCSQAGATNFEGTSADCSTTAGTAQPGGTEKCYDWIP